MLATMKDAEDMRWRVFAACETGLLNIGMVVGTAKYFVPRLLALLQRKSTRMHRRPAASGEQPRTARCALLQSGDIELDGDGPPAEGDGHACRGLRGAPVGAS
jgi:hypothetical protein